MDLIKPKGFIQAKITHKDTGKVEVIKFDNAVLNNGKEFLAKCLLEGPKPHIANILFGDGGTTNGEPKEILPTQDKLIGITRMKKSIISQIDPEMPTQIIFSVILEENECNDFPINEMALELSDETIFSFSNFADLNKTDQMEIAWSWFVCFI
jgi:hypothetical protein